MASRQHVGKKILNQEEILELLNQSDLSDISDESDDGWSNDGEDDSDTLSHSDGEDIINQPSTSSSDIPVRKTIERKHIWKSERMLQKGPSEDELDDVPEPPAPLDAFFEYLNIEFFEETAVQTNLYSVQKRNHKSVKTSTNEIMQVAGLHVLMGCLKFPQVKMYWSRDLSIKCFHETMTRDRLFELRNFLHFANNEEERTDNDKLWKIRPFLKPIREKCLILSRPKHISLDEQMIPFKGRCIFKQFVPGKPNPVGLKNFVLSARVGLVLDFAIYDGKGCVPPEDLKTLGLGGGIVKRLAESVPKNSNHVIYTDRYFTGIACAEYLLKNKIYLTGTVRSNRIGTAQEKLKKDREIQRGEWDELVRDDKNVCIVKWKDNKSVILLSTCVGSEPVSSCNRWSKEDKKKISIPQPAIVHSYNESMGGTDLCDRYLAYYRCTVKTKKWPVRVFSHFMDLSISNCWIQYVRYQKKNGIKQYMSLLEYRMTVAFGLLKYEGNKNSKKKRKTLCTKDEEENRPVKHRTVINQPSKEVRLDGVGHFPRFMEDKNASKCRLPECNSRTRVMCTKCNMYLCVSRSNCFERYHLM